jgi:putative ABC transport system permease protein
MKSWNQFQTMLSNYFRSILRYILRNKGFTIINVSGLAIGMMACVLIAQYVLHELSYDDFHAKKDRIYRLQQDRYEKGVLSTRWAAGGLGVGPDMKSEFPEVARYARMGQRGGVFSNADIFFKEDNIYHASEDFFMMFGFPLIEGVDSLVLKRPNTIVLSESTAKKYFGQENPIGKTLRRNGEVDYEVTGVFKDIPDNTHFEFDALMSFSTLPKLYNDPMTTWNWDGFFTYIELHENANVDGFKKKIPGFVEKKVDPDHKDSNVSLVFNLQKLTDIHLDSDFMEEFKANGNRQSTYFLGIVAVLILVIAWINYINLSTAKSIERAREVGVRKVMGSFRRQLVQQFILESFLLNSAALIIAIALAGILAPPFGDLTGRTFDFSLFQNLSFWLWTAALVSAGAILSGVYPAFVLSGYKPVEVLKGRFKNSTQGVSFRKAMVITQFVASITLLIGTFTVYRQITYMQDQKLGMNIEQTLIINTPRVVADSLYPQQYRMFRERLKQYSEVSAISASTSVPGGKPEWNAGGIRPLSKGDEETNQYRIIMMDEGYMPSYGLEVAAGRAFSEKVPNENENIILTESAMRLMGYTKFEEALDEQILFWGDTFRIVGIAKDFRQESLKKAYDALILRYDDAPGGFYSVKMNTTDVRHSLEEFQKEWKAAFPGNPFNYFFLDEYYNRQYQADQQFGKIFGVFSALAIFIACLGLLGLSSLTVLQRTKEIGVRKVLGASVLSVLTLIGKDYLWLLLISIVCAIPFAWWTMSSWLNSFANRIELSWWIFLLPSLLVIVIALSTVSILTLRSALTNPAKALRYE